MFARKVAVRLKANSLKQFVNLMEREVLPWLRMQNGFLDLITLATPDGNEVQVLSFWNQEGDAQAHYSSAYPTALKILETVLGGVPHVKTFDVVRSTVEQLRSSQPQAIQDEHEQASPEKLGHGPYEAAV